MDWMTRGLGIAIAVFVAGGAFLVIFALLGTALLGATAAVLAIPLAFPMTTVLVILVVGAGMAWTYMRREKRPQDQKR